MESGVFIMEILLSSGVVNMSIIHAKYNWWSYNGYDVASTYIWGQRDMNIADGLRVPLAEVFD